jgi:hypothetical protein
MSLRPNHARQLSRLVSDPAPETNSGGTSDPDAAAPSLVIQNQVAKDLGCAARVRLRFSPILPRLSESEND